MARKTFFDILSNQEFDTEIEMERIEAYFDKRQYEYDNTFSSLMGTRRPITLKGFINKTYFRNWRYARRYSNVNDLMQSNNIYPTIKNPSLEDMFIYFEFLLNILYPFQNDYQQLQQCEEYTFATQMCKEIWKNIVSALDELNYKSAEIEDGKFIIVEKSQEVSAISEIHPDIAPTIIEYKRFSLKGNLERKAELLNTLAKKFEKIKDKLNKNNYAYLVDEIGCLLNNLNIRHNNEDFVQSMKDKELESWYDKTYDTILLALMTAHYIDYKSDIKKLNKALKVK